MMSTVLNLLLASFAVRVSAEIQLLLEDEMTSNRHLSGGDFVSPQTAADKLSWDYNASHVGLNGVCSVAHKCGPASWSKITPTGSTVNMCGGSNQTPININPLSITVDSTLKYPTMVEYNGGCKTWTQFSDDHTTEVSFSDTGYVCKNFHVSYQGDEFIMLQMHFHSPAEHTVGLGYSDAELHMVHKSPTTGNYLVLGVMIEESQTSIRGANNVFLDKIWTAARVAAGSSASATDDTVAKDTAYEWKFVNSTTTAVHAYDFLPASKQYWTYLGSLTTYPCTEGIRWIVMKESFKISQYDLSILRKSVGYNPTTIINSMGNDNRPVQPVGTRAVYSYEGVDPAAVSGGHELTRDFAAICLLILVPVIIFVALWYFGYLAFLCNNNEKNNDNGKVDVVQKKLDDEAVIPPSNTNETSNIDQIPAQEI